MACNIHIYWDFENIRTKNDTNLVVVTNQIRNCLVQYGTIVSRHLYIDSQSPNEINTKRGELNLCGWSIIDCPHRNRKETIDKKIVMDVLSTVITCTDTNSLMICLITSDTDFSELFSKLRDFHIKTCLFHGINTTEILMNSPDHVYDWEYSVMKTNKKTSKSVFFKDTCERDGDCKEDSKEDSKEDCKESVTISESLYLLLCIIFKTIKNSTEYANMSEVAYEWYDNCDCGGNKRKKYMS